MKLLKGLFLASCFVCIASAQDWYAGVIGGLGVGQGLAVTNATGTATAGFQNGAVAGAFIGNDNHAHWGGELRYLYRQSNIKLTSGGTSTEFDARTNIIHYDVTAFPAARESRVRPFVAVGGGMQMLQGTGAESASQPLGNFVALTKTTETSFVVDGGAGIRANFGSSWQFRVEVRDYVSPAPGKVTTLAPGARMGSWMNDVIGMVSIAYTWH